MSARRPSSALARAARDAVALLDAARAECRRLAKGGPVAPTASAAGEDVSAGILAGAALDALHVAKLAALASDHPGDAAALDAVACHLAALRVASV